MAYDLVPKEKRALIEQHLIEQNVTWDQQLNDPKNTISLSDRIITSEFLIQEISNFGKSKKY